MYDTRFFSDVQEESMRNPERGGATASRILLQVYMVAFENILQYFLIYKM